MLNILFILLKIVGIILLLFLLMIIVILTVPVRYSFEMEKKETAPFCGQCRVTWLMSILYLKVSYIDKVLDYRIRVFGLQIAGNQDDFVKKKEEKRKRKEEKEKKKAEQQTENADVNQPESENNIETDNRLPAKEDTGEITELNLEQEMESEKAGSSDGKSTAAKEEEGQKEKPSREKIPLKKRVENIKNKVVALKENSAHLKELMESWHISQLLQLAKKTIGSLLRHVLPRKLKGWIRFGFDDPANTGMVSGVAAVFYPAYQKTFVLQPDFQEKCFEGNCRGRGRIRLGYLLYIGITLLLDKNIRRLIKQIIQS